MQFIENIIIGCGPAALQCAYFFEKYNIEYLILERNSICGSFFSKYPHSGQLISINKKNTGNTNEDFNLRHDWNSLLNDEKQYFTDYTDEYYPDRDMLVKYLNDFAKNNKIKIAFNKPVSKITKENGNYKIAINNANEIYTCNKLIMATGLSKPNYPQCELNIKDPIKHYGDYDVNYFKNENNLNEFKNKRVLIIGNGNSGFELSNILTKYASNILITFRTWAKFAFNSHYAGDVRGIYLSYLDTFLLKSLNALNDVHINDKLFVVQKEYGGSYYFRYCNVNYNINEMNTDNMPAEVLYDKVIFCTGWKFDDSIFDFDLNKTINDKYPKLKDNYESTNNDNLFFIGSLMHSFDYKKSSGGFIHGFRYLIKLFVKLNYYKSLNIANKMSFLNDISLSYKLFHMKTSEDVHVITAYIIERLNTSSDMYQMFGIIKDIIYYNQFDKQILYFTNVKSTTLNNDNSKNIICFHLSLEYGKQTNEVDNIGRKMSNLGSESNSLYIHPIIKIYDGQNKIIEIVHLDEDLFANFHRNHEYYSRIYRLLQSYSL